MYKQLIVVVLAFSFIGCVQAAMGKHGNKWDKTPDQFVFVDQIDASPSTLNYSNSITISGINTATTISISGGEYAINGGAYINYQSDVNLNDIVMVRQTSSADFSSTTDTSLTVGGVSDTFSVTTLAGGAATDITPDAFSFIDQNSVAPGTTATSNAIWVSGINAPTTIAISNGLYSVNGGTYVATDGDVVDGDNVTIQLLASNEYSTTTQATLTIGGVSDSFSITTEAAPSSQIGFVLDPLPQGNPSFTSEHFSGSGNCSMCHNGLSDSSGNDVSIITDWSSSMMANSTRDPFWRAKLRSELNRNPGLADIINDKCTRCHAPMANEEMRRNGEFISVLDSGLLNSSHHRNDEAMEGVSCTLCHQIIDSPKLGTLDGFSGKYEVNDTKTIYGQYSDIFGNPMINNTGYTPVYSAHISESELCASCHNLKTPYVDEFGNLLSHSAEDEFPEQMPYSEWLNSDYATQQSCQDCHMSRADGVTISTRPMWLGPKDNFSMHDFIGANKTMLNILDNNREQLGVRSNNFAETIAKTDAMLTSAANIQLTQSSFSGGVLDFTLKVNSTTGHKLPSAYPSRRVILHVTVRDGGGKVVFESGRVNSDGSVVGVDADTNPQVYEPHHDLITDSSQVQVYEAIMGNNHDQVTYTLLRGATYLKDNRLLPTGFDKASAPADVAVAGAALSDNNFTGGSDQVQYQISNLPADGYTIDAELVYQTIAYGFVQDLFADAGGEINDFKVMYEASNHKSNVMTSVQFNIQ